MKIDRSIQVKILEYLASFYPKFPPEDIQEKLFNITQGDLEVLDANLAYLIESGYINKNCKAHTLGGNGPEFIYNQTTITNQGIDFLQDDGGLTAIKNTITVRFHADTLAMLANFIKQSSLPETKKQSFVHKLQGLPVTAIEHLMKKLLDTALSHSSDVFQLIENSLRLS